METLFFLLEKPNARFLITCKINKLAFTRKVTLTCLCCLSGNTSLPCFSSTDLKGFTWDWFKTLHGFQVILDCSESCWLRYLFYWIPRALASPYGSTGLPGAMLCHRRPQCVLWELPSSTGVSPRSGARVTGLPSCSDWGSATLWEEKKLNIVLTQNKISQVRSPNQNELTLVSVM